MSDMLSIVIRIMPEGKEIDVEVPVFSTGKDIIDELLGAAVAPRTDNEGNAYVYKLVSKANNVEVGESKTLIDLNIRNGETLFFVPKIVAG